MKIKRSFPTRKQLSQRLKQIQLHVRSLAGLVDPPFLPEDYATAANVAQSLITQLGEADAKDGGRRSTLVPIMLYDALLDGSIKGLQVTGRKESDPVIQQVPMANPFTQPMGDENV